MVGYDEEEDFQGPQSPTIDRGVVEGEEEEEEEEEEEDEEEENSNDSTSQIEPATPFLVSGSNLKTRLRWTPHLHASFVDAINQLGGPHKATPKSIMRIMDVKGITLFHLKSHLQKYRLGRYGVKEWREGTSYKADFQCQKMKEATVSQVSKEQDGTSTPSLSLLQPHENEICELNEDTKAQKEVQEKLCLQNEAEKHLQLRQNAERRYLSIALDNACENLAHQFLGGLAADFAGVFGHNESGLETMGSIPHQLSFAHQLGRFQPPREAYLATQDHLVSDGHSGNLFVENFHICAEDQLGRIQPKIEAYFATEDNLISDGHSGNSSVEDFSTLSADVTKEVESLDEDPAEAYLILDTTETGSGNLKS